MLLFGDTTIASLVAQAPILYATEGGDYTDNDPERTVSKSLVAATFIAGNTILGPLAERWQITKGEVTKNLYHNKTNVAVQTGFSATIEIPIFNINSTLNNTLNNLRTLATPTIDIFCVPRDYDVGDVVDVILDVPVASALVMPQTIDEPHQQILKIQITGNNDQDWRIGSVPII
jgi:hypothetical protein